MKVENNLDTDKVRGLVWRLAFPSMLAQFVNVLYSIVDRMYIGNIQGIGALALAGVGICGPVVTLISSFASWIGVGGAPLMSIRLGQKNERAAAQMVANCFALLTGMAVVIMTMTFLFRKPLLVFFGASPSIFPYANEYMSWYLSGTVFALLAAGMNQFIICQGFAKVPYAILPWTLCLFLSWIWGLREQPLPRCFPRWPPVSMCWYFCLAKCPWCVLPLAGTGGTP